MLFFEGKTFYKIVNFVRKVILLRFF